jgi:hypothetical protein
MTFLIEKKRRRRQIIILDWRGLPARHVPVERAARHFGQLVYWVRRNGICVITENGKPAYVLLSPHHYLVRTGLVFAAASVAAVRRRNPGGVFTLADQVFGSRARANLWMVQKNWSLGDQRPLDKLATPDGVAEVQTLLHRIEHGIFR